MQQRRGAAKRWLRWRRSTTHGAGCSTDDWQHIGRAGRQLASEMITSAKADAGTNTDWAYPEHSAAANTTTQRPSSGRNERGRGQTNRRAVPLLLLPSSVSPCSLLPLASCSSALLPVHQRYLLTLALSTYLCSQHARRSAAAALAMLSFRRKSSLAVAGKSDVATSPPAPPSALVDDKVQAHDDEREDIFGAILSSASSKQQPPATAVARDEYSKDEPADEEKEGKRSLPPAPGSVHAVVAPPALPSFSRPEITPENLRALTAIPSVERGVDESKEAGAQSEQQHVRKTSSTALIAELLGAQHVAPALAPSASPASRAALSPPPLLSGATVQVETTQRRELPVFNMREFHGEMEQKAPAVPPPTPLASALSVSSPPSPLRRSPPPAPPRALPPPMANVPSDILIDTASPSAASNSRLPPMAPTAAFARSPPPRPSQLSVVRSTPPVAAVSDEGVPSAAYVPALATASVANPFDDEEYDEVEGQVRTAAPVQRLRVVAVAAYSTAAPDQLSLAPGEELDVVDDSHANWTLVCNAQGSRGLVPASYVRKQRKEEAGSTGVGGAAGPPLARRQSSLSSHRRTVSQPSLQMLAQQPRSPITLSVPASPVHMIPPPVPASPSTSPPLSTLRLPPPSPSTSSAPIALRSPPPPSQLPPLPRPLSTPPSPAAAVPPAPLLLPSPLASHEPKSPSLHTAGFARPTSPAIQPRSPSFAPAPPIRLLPASPSAPEPVAPAPAMLVCEAAHSYTALAADQLSLALGEKLLLVDRHHPHWWKVVNGAGDRGLVPTTYIKLLEAPSAATSSFAPPAKPPSVPPPQPSAVLSPSASALVAVPPSLTQVRSPPPPPTTPRPSPPPPALSPTLPAASSQPPMPPPLTIPHPARSIQQQVAATPTAASITASSATSAAPHHRHSMSLNTISAPAKRTLPAALTIGSAPSTPVAAVEQPAFPLPPSAAARTAPMPPPQPRPPAHIAATPLAAAAVPAAVTPSSASPAAVSVGTLVAERGEAVHSFDATDGVQLSVCKGDELFITQRLETGWSVCRLLHTGISGLVPTSYIRSTTDRPSAA